MRRIRRGILGEDRAAGVGDAFVSSRSDLSKQGLELGEDLLDWVDHFSRTAAEFVFARMRSRSRTPGPPPF